MVAVAMPESGWDTSRLPNLFFETSTLFRWVKLSRLVRCHSNLGPLVATPTGLSCRVSSPSRTRSRAPCRSCPGR